MWCSRSKMFLILLQIVSVVRGSIFGVDMKTPLKPISIPALGRPFALGDLYDRKRDFIIPGPKIWSNQELAEYDETKTYSTNFEVSNSLDVNEGLSHFDIKASMKMSFLSGRIAVAGSAAYLQDRVSKNRDARVALKYSSTTFKRSIRPTTFTKATYMSVLKKVTAATDVIAAIQYGAGAVFVFDRTVRSNEQKRDIEGMLKVSVKKIPSFEINGTGSVSISEADKRITENFTCKFHGDFVLEEHPGNYEEAIRVYKTLPSLLGDDYENSVPIKVWLYPLEMLPLGKSASTIYEVQENLITYIADEIDAMENFLRQSNDLLDTPVPTHHPRIRKNLLTFQQYINLYMMDFKQKLADLLPQIREGTQGSKALVELIEEKHRTPFSIKNLDIWMNLYNDEVNVLRSISDLPNYCKDEAEFGAMLLNDRQFTISLTLKLSTQEDKQLKAMQNYLNGIDVSMQNSEHKVWWRPGQKTLANLQKYSAMIKKYNDIEEKRVANGEGSNIQFVVMEQILSSDYEPVEVVIDQYENGKLQIKNLEIPSTVNNIVIVSTSYDSVTLKWDLPSEGARNVKNYRVVAFVPNSNNTESRECDEFFCEITSIETKNNEVKIGGLEASKNYVFAVETYCILGKSAESYKTNMVQTTKCPPGMHHIDEHHCKHCKPGQFSDVYGAMICRPCPLGHFSDVYKSPQCKECPAGTYNSETGRTLKGCIKCPEGTYGSEVGAIGFWACKGCPVGTYNSKMGQISLNDCLKCPKGKFSSNIGMVHCESCPFGSQTDGIGSVSPASCHRGEVMDLVEKSTEVLKKSADTNIARLKMYWNALKAKEDSYFGIFLQAKKELEKEICTLVDGATEAFEKHHYVDG